MKKSMVVVYVCALLLITSARTAQAALILTPLPEGTYITVADLDWAWASPVSTPFHSNNILYAPELHEGWRYATAQELANRPLTSAFLIDPLLPANPANLRNAAPYWNSVYTHIDYGDTITSTPMNGSIADSSVRARCV